MDLFQWGEFKLASGQKSWWKVQCDELTMLDWRTLAAIAVEGIPNFDHVEAIPTGGLPFAAALRDYVTPGAGVTLLADDVWTTGSTMTRYMEMLTDRRGCVFGVVAFARGPVPSWVRPVWSLNQHMRKV